MLISPNRIFLGGGGGGSEGNNNASTDGGNGGGIILVKANSIITTGSCGGGRIISANGANANNASAGDGAGGSILINTSNWSVSNNCSINIQSNGGNGGNVSHNDAHGGGGGGGQGVAIFPNATFPTSLVNVTTVNGNAGCDNNPCASSGTQGGGVNNIGIIDATSNNPLPVELNYFIGLLKNNTVALQWQTLTELNNHYFLLEKSVDGIEWNTFQKVEGNGNSNSKITYYSTDYFPFYGLSYYRLIKVDHDGKKTYYNAIPINYSKTNTELSIYPNPTSNFVFIDYSDNKIKNLIIKSTSGKVYDVPKVILNRKIQLDLSLIPSGINFIELIDDVNHEVYKVVKQ